jgi:epoxyqueuosine reductase
MTGGQGGRHLKGGVRSESESTGSAPLGTLMNPVHRSDVTVRIIAQAKNFGASLAGMASITALERLPSYDTCGLFPRLPGGSLLVTALVHGPSRPELDWWDDRKGGTPGNRRMEETALNLARWLGQELAVGSHILPYHVERGGVFLKDAAVLAGLGIIGRNNLLVTPEYGPRVRLRAMLVEVEGDSPENLDFDPCTRCNMPCRRACPRQAFARGSYHRPSCAAQMSDDEANRIRVSGAGEGAGELRCVPYCRACELACPIAR